VEDLCIRSRELCLLTLSYHTLGSPSRTSFKTRTAELPRENCTIGHTGQCQNRDPRVKRSLYAGAGGGLLTPLHTQGMFPCCPLSHKQDSCRENLSLAEITQHRSSCAEIQAPNTLSQLALLCLLLLVPVPPSLMPSPAELGGIHRSRYTPLCSMIYRELGRKLLQRHRQNLFLPGSSVIPSFSSASPSCRKLRLPGEQPSLHLA